MEFLTPSGCYWNIFHLHDARAKVLLMPVQGQSAKIQNRDSAAGRSYILVNSLILLAITFASSLQISRSVFAAII